MRWEKDTGQHTCGKILYLGKWKVGGYHWDSTRSQGDEAKWRATCALPGMRQSLGHFSKEEKAMEVAELAVTRWLIGSTSMVDG